MGAASTITNGIDFRISQFEGKLKRMQDFLDIIGAAAFDPADDNCFQSVLYHATEEFGMKPRELAMELGLHPSTTGRWRKQQNLPGPEGRTAVSNVIKDKIAQQVESSISALEDLSAMRVSISRSRLSSA